MRVTMDKNEETEKASTKEHQKDTTLLLEFLSTKM